MKQIIPGIKAIFTIPCSSLSAFIAEKAETGITVTIGSNGRKEIPFVDEPTLQCESAYQNNGRLYKTTLKFISSESIDLSAPLAFIALIKKKRKGKKLIDKTKLIQIRCLQADFQIFLDFLGKHSSNLLKCFNRRDCKCLQAAFKMYEQQKMMFEENVRTCADRIISIYHPADRTLQ